RFDLQELPRDLADPHLAGPAWIRCAASRIRRRLLARDQAKENERQPEIAALHHAPSPMRMKGGQVTQEDEPEPVSNLAFSNGYFGPMGARCAAFHHRRRARSRPGRLPDRDFL